jgi:hypothetical protein
VTGAAPLGNQVAGITVVEGSDSTTIGGLAPGAGNVIANTIGGPGVLIGVDEAQIGVVQSPILGNRIFANSGLGIDLAPPDGMGGIAQGVTPNDAGDADIGPNGLQNFPVINAVVSAGNATISGTLNSLASRSFRIEFFANTSCDPSGFGEGETFIGTTTVTTDGSGNASFGPLVLAVPPAQAVITATATDNVTSNTSEFSQCAALGPGATSTALVSSVNPSTVGQAVTFTATVTGNSPTGTVQFMDGAANLGSPVALSGGTAAFTTSALTVGTHAITAVYSGDASNAGSTSPVLNETVNGIVITPTTPIPTLSEWATVLLAGLLGWLGLRRLRGRGADSGTGP